MQGQRAEKRREYMVKRLVIEIPWTEEPGRQQPMGSQESDMT